MRVHFIAIGGAAMHNLAIALQLNGFAVSGSDDVIYEPSKTRLQDKNLLPEHQGWYPDNITKDLDAIILGMHARIDNPELLRAQELGIPIYSYPAYIYEQSKNKTRVVIGGSHGKTTITSMILHVLNYYKKDFDYLVGAQLKGFDNMVKLSDAPLIVIEGDEYLASPIDRRPKFHLYKAHIGVISGVAWDHINVFPTFESYKDQFSIFINTIENGGSLIYCQDDKVLEKLVADKHSTKELLPYTIPNHIIRDGVTYILLGDKEIPLKIFGNHNLLNMQAALTVCNKLAINNYQFFEAIKSFTGAAKRLEVIGSNSYTTIFKDFAHSPSKLKATVEAVKQQYPHRKLIACIELHTFSSLNENFLKEYEGTLDAADVKIVFIDEKTFQQKGLKQFSENEVKKAFDDNELNFFNQSEKINSYIQTFNLHNVNLLMMSSGNFGGMDLNVLSKKLLLI